MPSTERHRPAVGVAAACAPCFAEQLRARMRCLLADCHAVSAHDPDAPEAIARLIDEVAALTAGVLRLMPGDAQALADALAVAHAILVCLIADVERAARRASCGARRRRMSVDARHYQGLATRRARPRRA